MKKFILLVMACGCQAPDLPTAGQSTSETVTPSVATAVVPTPIEQKAEVEEGPPTEIVEEIPTPEVDTPAAPQYTQVADWQSLKAVPKDFKMDLTVTVVQHPRSGPMKSYRVQLDRGLTATASNLSGSSKSKTKVSELTALATLGRLADIKFPDQYLIPDMSSCRMHESRTRYQLEVKLAGQFRKLDFVSGCGTSVPGVAELVQQVRYEAIDRAWFEKMDDYDAVDPDGVQPRVERFE